METILIVEKNGQKSIAEFPVHLKKGDRCIRFAEERSWTCPNDGTILHGYSDAGPIVTSGPVPEEDI